ncbi:uncharacterized protein [Mytilus edulis]|uniref:uncharacterized protein n=1 Tax=Mytilus edulis TaxID=6550 RepID=UPI0039EEF20A
MRVKFLCMKGHQTSWESQPLVNNKPAGNLMVATAVILSSETFARLSHFAETFTIVYWINPNLQSDGTHRISDFSGPLQALRLQISQLESWLQTEIHKAMATDHSNKKHQFDVWHLSKSIKKKILVIKPQKLLNEVKPWIPSICNHIWYCSRQADGDSDEET